MIPIWYCKQAGVDCGSVNVQRCQPQAIGHLSCSFCLARSKQLGFEDFVDGDMVTLRLMCRLRVQNRS